MARGTPLTNAEMWAFLQARKRGDTEALIDALRQPEFRSVAVRRLGELGAREAIPQIAPLLGADDQAVRTAAVVALGRLGATSQLDRIVETARFDSVPVVRSWATGALGALGDESCVEPLALLARDANRLVHISAIGGLLSIDNETAQQRASEALSNLGPLGRLRYGRRIRRITREIERERR